MPTDPNDIRAIALLDDPIRRALYEWVVDSGRAVSRDEASVGVKVSRSLAAFHLDRLTAAGLLVAEFRRLSGRTGPGAGRPAKLYRRGPQAIAVHLPHRDYALVAHLFAGAIEGRAGGRPPARLRESAREVGRSLGAEARARVGRRPGKRQQRTLLVETLAASGYEPRVSPSGDIRLGNCPFFALVADHRPLVCGTNLALAEGLVEAIGGDLEARQDPQPGQCCVTIS